ncbi:hypothetical protein JYT16_01510 [Gemmatimonas aurantiaca]|nr:hypothetical protein [Gemmatimonas aurantiaca]
MKKRNITLPLMIRFAIGFVAMGILCCPAYAVENGDRSATDVFDTSAISEALRELVDLQFEQSPRQLYSDRLRSAYRTTIIGSPRVDGTQHILGNISLTKTNQGHFRNGYYPSSRGEVYLAAAGLWIGSVTNRDTLVSTGMDDAGIVEFWPDKYTPVEQRSINPNSEYYHPDAVSEQDLIATYYDTLTHSYWVRQDIVDKRPHKPIGLKIVERSMQWSYEYTSDFILFDYEITNLNKHALNEVYIGIYVDGDTYFTLLPDDPILLKIIFPNTVVYGSKFDDLCGILKTYPSDCGFIDTLNTAYIMDNDGDPIPPQRWSTVASLLHTTGVRMLRTPSKFATSQFNWWITGSPWYDFGPRRLPSFGELRNMNGFLGTPYGDKNKFYVMSNGEHDYHQLTSAINQEDEGWLAPHSRSRLYSAGGSVRFLLSYGPFKLFPGKSVPLTFAFVGGKNVHRKAGDFRNLHDPLDAEPYLSALDFSDLAINSRWANWIYDNPGVDTDFDGYRGETRDCVLASETIFDTTLTIDSSFVPYDTTILVDTVSVPTKVKKQYYVGDGIPDFVGAAPPPTPIVRVLPEIGRLVIRWNGHLSETTPDPFSDELDFEGYRIYSSLTGVSGQFTMLSSYDIEDYNRYEYDEDLELFTLTSVPFSLEELHQLYGNTFDPFDYGVDNPLVASDESTGLETIYYFTTTDWNYDDLTTATGIHKRFPNALKPPTDENLWTPDDFTEGGHLKYYEYEYVVENLLPSMPLYVSVSAFDYGAPSVNLPSLESDPRVNMIQEYPLKTAQKALADGDPIIVFPNPYRADGNYREGGFEAVGRQNFIRERTRKIHFINIPLVCTISIYSIDGDLVGYLEHNRPDGGARAIEESWNVLSRNLQPVVSGVYYWVVEEPDGSTQIGKLAIIK